MDKEKAWEFLKGYSYSATSYYIWEVSALENVDGLFGSYENLRELPGYYGCSAVSLKDILQLKKKVESMGIRDRWYLRDMCLMSTCRIFTTVFPVCIPSLYEGFGLPLEAMTCGTPNIPMSPIPEVVGDGALLTDPYNIDELTEKSTGRFQMQVPGASERKA